MVKLNKGQNLFIIATVALVMLVQSFVLAWSAAAAPSRPMLDIFGNPLCITSVEHDGEPQDHSKLPNCCTSGCGLASWFLAAPELQSTQVEWTGPALFQAPRFSRSVVSSLPPERPGRPRGPPPASR